ncbi:MAG: efflux RND transporter periplasmic adaptor subunit [Verrucomicrobia bacterium]|nr:efflux RND transporter periplasmic adaptor subunit [Verrucomicrobiota bacterium]
MPFALPQQLSHAPDGEGRTAGRMRTRVRVRWASGCAGLGFALVACLAGCGKPQATQAPLQPPTVTVAKPIQKQTVDHSEYTGRLSAVDNVDIRPRVSGYIDSVHFKEGDLVTKGQLLFIIDPRPYQAALDQAKGQLSQAEAQQKLNDANFARAQDLRAKGVIASADYDTAVAQKSQADAQVVAAQAAVESAQLNFDFTQLKAPVAGRVSREQITVGNLVQADQSTLTNIVSVDPIYAYAEVDENTVLRFRKLVAEGAIDDARQAQVPITIALGSQNDFAYQGVIDFIDNKIDSGTGTLQIRGKFDNPRGILLPGLFVRVQVPTSKRYDALLISDQAVISDQGLKFVFVATPDQKAKQIRVTLGPLVDGLRVVRAGLKPDDEVIVDGIVKVRPGMPLTIEQGDMKNFASEELNVDVATNKPPPPPAPAPAAPVQDRRGTPAKSR